MGWISSILAAFGFVGMVVFGLATAGAAIGSNTTSRAINDAQVIGCAINDFHAIAYVTAFGMLGVMSSVVFAAGMIMGAIECSRAQRPLTDVPVASVAAPPRLR